MIDSTEHSVICIGWTPCVQRILQFERVTPGAVNRALRVQIGIGGKGANTARMVRQLGGHPLLLGFTGGANGRLLEELLAAEQVPFRHIATAGETRFCQTLVEAGNPETTELVEEMPPLGPEEWAAMEQLAETVPFSGRVIAVSGRLPDGAPENAYARLCEKADAEGGRVIIDTSGPALMQALPYRPALVKINDEELRRSSGIDPLPDACRELMRLGARAVLITRGARSAFYFDETLSLELIPPVIQAVNPVGSGDAVTAGLAVAMEQGLESETMLRQGMACGAANALHLISGSLNPREAAGLQDSVAIRCI